MTNVINRNGAKVNFDAAVELMDDDICAELNKTLAPCKEQEFFSAYEKSHEEKYGHVWELSKEHPVY